jgi:NADH:ubiquinone oxidoreductase subunit D
MKLEDQRTTVYKVDPNHPETESLPTLRTEELLLNMGPQHPSTHGVLKVILELEGERIVKSTPVLGFLHRGVEKLAEDGTYHQFIPHTDRLDYVCAMYNNFAYCRAVEKLMDITLPDRAEYLRTLVAEVQRIIGHLFWLGTQALDIGAMTVFLYCFREREDLMDCYEAVSGARMHATYYRPGGVARDLPLSMPLYQASRWKNQAEVDKINERRRGSMLDFIERFIEEFPAKVDEYETLLTDNRIWKQRTVGIGVV